MRHLHNSLSVLFVGALFLAGCAGCAGNAQRLQPRRRRSNLLVRRRHRRRSRAHSNRTQGASVEGMTVFEMQERLERAGLQARHRRWREPGRERSRRSRNSRADNKLSPTGTIDPDTISKLRAAIK